MVAAPPIKRNPKDEDHHNEELLFRVQKLGATVKALCKPDDRAIYDKELETVAGLLIYAVPENSPMAKYLHQERRDRVAEQINNAVLRLSIYSLCMWTLFERSTLPDHTNMPSVSYLELAVRYTHCLWATLHELRVKVPAAHRPGGVSPPHGTGPQGAGESDKEPFLEVSFPCVL